MKRRIAIVGAGACLLTAALATFLVFPNAAGARASGAAAIHARASAARANAARVALVTSSARALLSVADRTAASSHSSQLRVHAGGYTAGTSRSPLNRGSYLQTGTARSGYARVAYRGMRATYAGSGGAGTGTMAHGCNHTTSSTTPSGK